LEPQGVDRGVYLLSTTGGDIGFNDHSDFWLDAAVLEGCAHDVLSRPIQSWRPGDASRLDVALALYRGDLLDGCYDDWALRERERLRDLYLRSLAHLMVYARANQEYERSEGYAQRILYHDPLREEIHRDLMQLYALTGRRTLALRQYEICRELLARELGIPPMEETQRLAEILRSDAALVLPQEPPTIYREAPNVEHVLQQFAVALQLLQQTEERFRDVAQLLQQLLNPSQPPSL
jgi:tetratricopeptide (TPR) repeat protein